MASLDQGIADVLAGWVERRSFLQLLNDEDDE